MRTTTLPGTDVPTSVLGLGTAGLFALPHREDRLRVLAVAHGAGIVHFDTAPMYGLGLAERELGQFARGRRDQLVIATKFGIAPTMICRGLARIQGPVRRVLAAAPAVRDRVRSAAAGPGSSRTGVLLYSAVGYGPLSARRSLHSSLRALGTDYVDLFLLHEACPGDVRAADICAYLEQARDAGLIRAWGVAGERGPSTQVAQLLCGPGVLQVREDILLRLAATSRVDGARITFGALGRALPYCLELTELRADRAHRWPTGSELDRDRRQALAEILVRDALRANPNGVVLLGTTNLRHLNAAVAAAQWDLRVPDPAVTALIGYIREASRSPVLTDPSSPQSRSR